MFRTEKIQRNTMRVFEIFSLQAKEMMKTDGFKFANFDIFTPKRLSDFSNFLPDVFHFPINKCRILMVNPCKNPLFWPIFGRKIDFLQFYPRNSFLSTPNYCKSILWSKIGLVNYVP